MVLLHGARQTGKSTLAQHIATKHHPAQYLTLDDASILTAAHTAPDEFVAGLEGAVVIDEVQRAPELFRAIKLAVDRRRVAGRFLLTGSANMLLVPRLSESLAGRMAILTLFPFSQGEMERQDETFIARAFADKWDTLAPPRKARTSLVQRLALGGYPEIQTRTDAASRSRWFQSYITTILQRDVRDLASIEGLTLMPRLLSLLAARTSSLLNIAELSRSIALPQSTLKRYMTLLETTYLIMLLPAWATNRGKRLIKTPKVFMADTGLATHLLGMNERQLLNDADALGKMMETFVVMELMKQATWSDPDVQFYYYRTADGNEVDIVLEQRDGTLVGIEVKSGSTIDPSARKGFNALAESAGKKFHRGIILYAGAATVSYGKNIVATPIESLWV